MHRHFRLVTAWLVGASFVLLAFMGPQAGQAAGNRVTDVHYSGGSGSFKVTVVADGAVTTRVDHYSVDVKNNVQDVVVDVSPAAYGGRTRVIGFTAGPLRQVRVGELSQSPAIMRIVVESKGAAQVDVQRQNGNKEVALDVHTSQTAFGVPTGGATASGSPASKMKPVAVTPLAAKPVTHAASPTKVVVAKVDAKPATPITVARATPNPWLPGGKYYCKIPGMPGYRPPGGAGASSNVPGAVGAYAGERTISIDVKNADILDVLRLLAEQSGQNIIATQNVKGTTSVSLHDVPLTTALDLIVRTNGLEYRKIGNVYVVGTPDDLAKQFGSQGASNTQTVAFPIKYANPADLGKSLATVVPATAFSVDARTDTLLVTGTPDIIQSVRNYLALADVPAPQITFEVKVLDVTRNDNANAGINWAGSSAICLFELPVGSTTCPPSTLGLNSGVAPNPFVRTSFAVNGTINYLITHNEAQLLADPRVAALDNQQASLLIGQTYPIVYFSAQAGNYQVQYIDIGVKLIITPVINADGFITTTLHVERSVIAGFVQQYPILDNRKVDSVLRVKDGDTIVLGGLIDDETTNTISKVPLLGDIPIFGAIFKNRQQGKIHNEVIFLITPHMLAGS